MKRTILFLMLTSAAMAEAEMAPIASTTTIAISSPVVVDEQALWLSANRAAAAREKFRPADRFFKPDYLAAPLSGGSTWVTMSAAIGPNANHGARRTWLYEFSPGHEKPRRLFTLPFDCNGIAPEPAPAVKGEYWVYDCFLCDGPEAGFVYKVPVIARPSAEGKRWTLRVDGTEADIRPLKAEVDRIMKNTFQKYGRQHRDANRLQREIETLFSRGLSDTPEPKSPERHPRKRVKFQP